MEMLPAEIWTEIFKFCPNKLVISMTCRWFYEIVRGFKTPRLCSWLYCQKLVELGHVDILRWVIQVGGDGIDLQPCIAQAVKEDNNDLFQELIKHHRLDGYWLNKTHKHVAGIGSWTIFQQLDKPTHILHTIINAMRNGHLDFLKHLHNNGYEMPALIERYIGEKGYTEMVKWICNIGRSGKACMAMGAVEGGHFELFKWLYENFESEIRTVGRTEMVNSATKSGDLEIIKWLYDKGFTISEKVSHLAGERGFIHILEWLKNKGHDMVPGIDYIAAVHNQLNVLKWLYKNEYEFNYIHMITTLNMKLDVLKWLHKKRCISDRVFDVGYSDNLLELLKWLSSNGYNCSIENAVITAVMRGQLDCLKYICERYEWKQHFSTFDRLYKTAATRGHLDCIKYLFESGCEFRADKFNVSLWGQEPTLSAVVGNGHFDVLKWVYKHGVKLTKNLYHPAYKYGRVDMINWLMERGVEKKYPLW